MLLAIDCGNTNTVFALYDGDKKIDQWRCITDDRRTADEYAVWLTQLLSLKNLNLKIITGAVIACVVPTALFGLKSFCERYFTLSPIVIGATGVDLGIEILIDRPEDVGEDRLVNAVAAHQKHRGSLIIIDFGTATSFDIVDVEGNFRGGVLAPGVNLSAEALYRAAARLPRVAIEKPPSVIGRATVPAMQSGLYWGYVAMIEGIVERIKAEYKKPMKVIATGGLALLFAHATPVIEAIDADITLRGLVLIYRRNQKSGQPGSKKKGKK
ncbi:MAG: type III pantothenate kinase [Alphaproteobacteria bacterium]